MFELEKVDTPPTLLPRHPDLSYTLPAAVFCLVLLRLWFLNKASIQRKMG